MGSEPCRHGIHKSLNAPLTILGAERKLFFLAVVTGAATFNFFGSLLGGLLMFVVLFLAARFATGKDPQLLKIVLSGSRLAERYDPAKREPVRRKGARSDDSIHAVD